MYAIRSYYADKYNNDSPEGCILCTKPRKCKKIELGCIADRRKSFDEDKLPDKAKQQPANYVRHEKYGAQRIACLEWLGQQVAKKESKQIG